MSENLHDSSEKDPQTLEREIDQTRAEMDRTLGALEQKLSPSNLVDQAMEYLRTNGTWLADNAGRFAKEHPLPVALAGLGLAWMFVARRSSDEFETHGYLDPAHDYDDADDEYVGGRAAVNRSPVSLESDEGTIAGVKERVSSSARQVAQRARAKTDRLTTGITSMAEEQPLVLGAIGFAIGAAVGAALPESESERRWLGPTRNKTVEKVKEQSGQAYEQVRAAAVRGVEGVKEAVSNVAGGSNK